MTRRGMILPMVVALLINTPKVRADGGVVKLRQTEGAFVVTLLTTPDPLREGPVDVSVMVQDRVSLEPILDANVSIHLRMDNRPEVYAQLSRANALNKLLYAAPVLLPKSGRWRLALNLKCGHREAVIHDQLDVAPAGLALASYWAYVALPATLIVLFALREWLIKRRPCRAADVSPLARVRSQGARTLTGYESAASSPTGPSHRTKAFFGLRD